MSGPATVTAYNLSLFHKYYTDRGRKRQEKILKILYIIDISWSFQRYFEVAYAEIHYR